MIPTDRYTLLAILVVALGFGVVALIALWFMTEDGG